MRRYGRNIFSVLLAVSLLAVVVPASVVLADDEPPKPPQDTLTTRVAEILGIDQQTLENALEQAQQEQWLKALENRLEQMVEKGVITAEQAQALKDWIKARPNIPGLGRAFRFGAVRIWGMRQGTDGQQDTLLARVAEILGIDQQKLEDAFKQARQEQQEKMLDEWLKKLVDKGVLTEEQAKAYRDWAKARPEGAPGILCPGIAPGRFGRHMLPWGKQSPDNAQGTGTSLQSKPVTTY